MGIVALAVIATVLPNIGRPKASARDLDHLGIALFTAGVVPMLIGLSAWPTRPIATA